MIATQKSPNQSAKDSWKVLSVGQFFFVKIWAGSDLLSVAELQLLWEDKVSNQSGKLEFQDPFKDKVKGDSQYFHLIQDPDLM